MRLIFVLRMLRTGASPGGTSGAVTASEGWFLQREQQVWLPRCLFEFLVSGGCSGVDGASGSWMLSLEEVGFPLFPGRTQAGFTALSAGREKRLTFPVFSPAK